MGRRLFAAVRFLNNVMAGLVAAITIESVSHWRSTTWRSPIEPAAYNPYTLR